MIRKLEVACVGILLLALGGATIGAIRTSHDVSADATLQLIPTLRASDVIGGHPSWLGDVSAPVSVVIFGDYQCTVCRQTAGSVLSLVDGSRGRIRVSFRNLPLRKIHPQSEAAALAAEAAREQGHFWEMHDLLMTWDISPSTIRDAAVAVGLDLTRFTRIQDTIAKKWIAEDELAAQRLRVAVAPTIFVCKSDGSVMTAKSFAAVKSILK